MTSLETKNKKIILVKIKTYLFVKGNLTLSYVINIFLTNGIERIRFTLKNNLQKCSNFEKIKNYYIKIKTTEADFLTLF